MENELVLKGFDFIKELVVQLITLSTGILALSISFLEKLKNAENNKSSFNYLKRSWIGYLLSIILGIWTFMAISGNLMNNVGDITINIRIPQALQIITFIISTFFIIRFGIKSLKLSLFKENFTDLSVSQKERVKIVKDSSKPKPENKKSIPKKTK